MLVVLPEAPLFLTTIHRFVTDLSLRRRELSVLLLESSLLLSTVSKLLGRFSVIPESNGLRIVSHQFQLLKWEACSFAGLHTLAISIFEFCIRNNIELSVQWIPRSLNQKADSVNKFMDIDDWQIMSEFFGLLEQYWSPHTIDYFANF